MFRRLFRRHTTVRFPLEVRVEGEVTITIHSHAVNTAVGSIDCWTYVTNGLNAFEQNEILMTVKREPGEPPDRYPEEVLDYFAAVVPLARNGSRIDPGGFTRFGPEGGLFGGHLLYVGAQGLPGVELPPRAIAAVAGEHVVTIGGTWQSRVLTWRTHTELLRRALGSLPDAAHARLTGIALWRHPERSRDVRVGQSGSSPGRRCRLLLPARRALEADPVRALRVE